MFCLVIQLHVHIRRGDKMQTGPRQRGVFERNGKWWIRVPTGEPGKYRREPVGTYEAAVALYQRRVGATGPTLSEAMEAWLRCHPHANHAYFSHARYFQERFPGVALSEFVRIENLRSWRDSHAREVKAATVNHRMAFLSNVFFKAIEDGLMEDNPIGGGKGKNRLQRLPVRNGRTAWLREEQEERLKDVLLPRIWDSAEFAIHTGLRRGEQWALEWEDWDGAGSIWVKPAKTERGRRVYLNEIARRVLEKRKAEGLPRPFPFLQAAGLSRTFNNKAKEVGLVDLTWHSLRHTSGTRMVRRGSNLRVVQRHLGHSSLAITERYTHVEDDQLIEEVNKLAIREYRASG